MPLYMDVHHKVEGLTAKAVAEAHAKDLEVQDQYGVKYHKYWFDEGKGALCYGPAIPTATMCQPSWLYATFRESTGGGR